MKIRTFNTLHNGVFSVKVFTEDWSEADTNLIKKLGEPEINLGGQLVTSPDSPETPSKTLVLDIAYARIMTESPFCSKFDSRDFREENSLEAGLTTAKELAIAWASYIESQIKTQLDILRQTQINYSTEQVKEY